MNFEMAEIIDDVRLEIKSFVAGSMEAPTRILDISDVGSEEISGLLFNHQTITEERFEEVQKESKYYPVMSSGLLRSHRPLKELSYLEGRNLLKEIQSNWVTQNNINLLENLFTVLKRMGELYPNERTAFFEELWFILKQNLGAVDLKIIYHELLKGKKENERGKLINVKIEGHKTPTPLPVSEEEEKLMAHYKDSCILPFTIESYDRESAELVLLGSIHKGPCLAMGRVTQLTLLQKSLLKSFFEGLNLILKH
jgi:hypothetical protein